jgi:uracil-DNA glycosylase
MRGAQATSWTAEDVAESYARWFSDAGLHSAVSAEPHGWLKPEPAAVPRGDARTPVQHVAEAAPVAPIRAPAGRGMPGDLAAFRTWLAEDASQPEATWNGPLFIPSAQDNAPLLVISEMPEDGADEGGPPFKGAAARLLTAMLGAIGLTIEQVAFAPLCMRRPPGGLIDEATFDGLTDRMRHYLALARPRTVLILGDRTSRALIAAQGAAKAGQLPEIHHKGGTVPAAAVTGLELLMRRPMAKAASWQTLRLLHGTLNA